MPAFVEEFVAKWTESVANASAAHDARIASGALVDWPMLNWPHLLLGNAYYFTILVVLYLWMNAKAEKFQLFQFMRVYNLTCVLFAGAVVYYIVSDMIIYGGPLKFVGNVDMFNANTERGARLQFAGFLFFIQKFWEFMDSFVFILRGRLRQLSFLHVYHHSSVSFVVFLFMYYSGSGDMVWGALINSSVHVLMYSHYLLATFKVNTWWKKYITQLQLVQFMVYFAQGVLTIFFTPLDQGWPFHVRYIVMAYDCTLIYLFMDFYIKSYTKSAEEKAQRKQQQQAALAEAMKEEAGKTD